MIIPHTPGQNGINTTEQRTTLGSVIFNGLTLMCVESGGSADWETAKTWNLLRGSFRTGQDGQLRQTSC